MKLRILFATLVAIFCAGLLWASPTDDRAAENDLLVKKFAPNFLFAAQEKYFPCDYSKYYFDQTGQEVTGSQALAKYCQKTKFEKLQDFEIFYEVKMSPEGDYTIQYWQFYIFNDFLNKHFGDAEVFTVFLDGKTGQALKFVGSAHLGSDTKIIAANNEIRDANLEHVTLLIEAGSHAIFPDANANGLPDAQELANWYNAYGITGWSINDAKSGTRVNFGDQIYKLTPIKSLQEKLANHSRLIKSPKLGIYIPIKIDLLLIKIEEEIYIPLGGEPVSLANIVQRLDDPQKVLPLDLGKNATTSSNALTARLQKGKVLSASIKETAKQIKEKPPKAGKEKPEKSKTENISPILINELCAGIDTADNEYLTVYNPNNFPISLGSGFVLKIANSAGKFSEKRLKFLQETIPAKGSFLLSPKAVKIGASLIEPDATYASGLSKIGCTQICLNNICDTLSFGEKILPCAQENFYFLGGGLKTDYCLRRKSADYLLHDSNNNQEDFSLVEQACPKNSRNQTSCTSPKNKTEERKIRKNITTDKKPSSGGGVPEKIPPPSCELKINEVMYNFSGSDTGKEWIEIYNNSNFACNLTEYKIAVNENNHKIVLASSSSEIAPNGYAILSPDPLTFKAAFASGSDSGIILKSALSLPNNGTTIYLKKDEIVIDSFSYASSSGANGNGNSLQLFDGSWLESVPTPNEKNTFSTTSIQSSVFDSLPQNTQVASSSSAASSTLDTLIPPIQYDLRINEIMYDASGSDSQKEWIEIYNAGEIVNLEACKILDWQSDKESSHNLYYLSPTSSLGARDFAIILNDKDPSLFLAQYPEFRSLLLRANFSLPNTTQKISLRCNDSQASEKTYLAIEGANGNGDSLQYFEDGWFESLPTPGLPNSKTNILNPTSSPITTASSSELQTTTTLAQIFDSPTAFFTFEILPKRVLFNASSSSCATGTIIQYDWDFGSGLKQTTNLPQANYSYLQIGQYNASLIVIDSNGLTSSPYTNIINVTEPMVTISETPKI
ncbi:MAG: lamin tail domain-containing protein [Candidatus Paceibacterota bacterium]